MTRLARIRDVFLPNREPRSALFCTYGFDARFFEEEILPAMLPNSLSLDRAGGPRPRTSMPEISRCSDAT